jgi:hypothetical protein
MVGGMATLFVAMSEVCGHHMATNPPRRIAMPPLQFFRQNSHDARGSLAVP